LPSAGKDKEKLVGSLSPVIGRHLRDSSAASSPGIHAEEGSSLPRRGRNPSSGSAGFLTWGTPKR